MPATSLCQKPVSVTVETITPEQAARYLERNASNRPLKSNLISQYAASLRSGEWELNGSTIVINDDRLYDGQHRLYAIVQTGIPMITIVVRNVSDDVFDTIDVGRRRSASDTFAIQGHKHTNALASAVREVWLYGSNNYRSNGSATNRSLHQLLELHPGIVDSVNLCVGEKHRIFGSGMTAGYHYLFSLVDPDHATRFITDLCLGVNLQIDDPVYHLRERLMDSRRRRVSTADRYLTVPIRRALIIKAFNYRLMGKKMRTLRLAAAEDFPVIVMLPPGFLGET